MKKTLISLAMVLLLAGQAFAAELTCAICGQVIYSPEKVRNQWHVGDHMNIDPNPPQIYIEGPRAYHLDPEVDLWFCDECFQAEGEMFRESMKRHMESYIAYVVLNTETRVKAIQEKRAKESEINRQQWLKELEEEKRRIEQGGEPKSLMYFGWSQPNISMESGVSHTMKSLMEVLEEREKP